MTYLILGEDGRLLDADTGRDCTDDAHTHLFDRLLLENDVELPLRSAFLLFQHNPLLQRLFKMPEAMLVEALGPLPAYSLEGGIPLEAIDHLALSRSFEWHRGTNKLEGIHSLSLVGLGPVLHEDVVEHGTLMYRAGTRVAYALEFTSCRLLLDLPLRYDARIEVWEADFDSPLWPGTHQTYQSADGMQLGEFLQALMDELVYHGEPDASDTDEKTPA